MVARVRITKTRIEGKGTNGIIGISNKARTARQLREWAFHSGMMPHVFLLHVSRGDSINGRKPTFDQRVDAAKACAPYFVPKLTSVAVSGEDGGPIKTQQLVLNAETLSRLSDGELEVFRYLFGKLSGQSTRDGDRRVIEDKRTKKKTRKQYTRTIDAEAE